MLKKNKIDYSYPSDIDNLIIREYNKKKFPRVPKFYANKNLYTFHERLKKICFEKVYNKDMREKKKSKITQLLKNYILYNIRIKNNNVFTDTKINTILILKELENVFIYLYVKLYKTKKFNDFIINYLYNIFDSIKQFKKYKSNYTFLNDILTKQIFYDIIGNINSKEIIKQIFYENNNNNNTQNNLDTIKNLLLNQNNFINLYSFITLNNIFINNFAFYRLLEINKNELNNIIINIVNNFSYEICSFLNNELFNMVPIQ